MPAAAEQSSILTYRYAVFHYITGEPKDRQVPVGVALWSPETGWARFQLLREGEVIAGASARELGPYVRATEEQLRGWLREERVPYSAGEARPSEDAWWQAVSDLLRFRVQISAPRPIDCQTPDAEFELLYEAIVAPRRSSASKRQRVDHAIGRAVRPELSRYFRQGVEVPAFGGAAVEVLRAYTRPGRQVILEGANLAAYEAEREADALASKLQRILAADGVTTRFVLGVLAPPGGLNGAGHLKQWIEEKSGFRVYDLTSEAEGFSSAAERELTASQEGDLRLF
jgi:hypothetical protein